MYDLMVAAKSTAVYPAHCGMPYCALGLAGETGEVVEHVKKMLRDDGGVPTEERRDKIQKELGDVLWYWLMLHEEFGLDPDKTASRLLAKLQSRKEQGLLQGSGSDREERS